MLFSVIIVVIMILAVIRGWRKGLVNQLFSFIGYLLAAAIAFVYVEPVATGLRMFSNQVFQTHDGHNSLFWLALGFLATFIVTAIVLRIVSGLLDRIVSLPILRFLNALAGAFLGIVISWLVLFLVINGLLLLSNGWIDSEYSQSQLAQTISLNSPSQFRQTINR